MAIWNRIWNLVRADRHAAELDDELSFHLAMRSRDNMTAGMTPAEAERDARLRFGNLTAQKERTRDASIVRWLDSLAQDARYTVRSLTKSRGVSALVIAALALGIGANTAIFSIAHALLLRALPVKDPAALVNLSVGNFMSWGYIEADDSFTYPLWQQVIRRQDALGEMFAYANAEFDIALNGETKQVKGAFVSGEAFPTLGIAPTLGRAIGPGDDRAGSPAVAVISYRLWEGAFAGDPAALGRTVMIEGKPFSVVGVVPPRFFGLTVGSTAEVYLPLSSEPYLRGKDSAFENDTRYWLLVFGRLRPGLSMQQAKARLSALGPVAMRATLPSSLPERVRPRYLEQSFVLRPAASGISYVRSSLELPLAILSGIVFLLLLLASFTVANLLLARATARQKEIAVRIALGASRRRIMRQVALETLVLALAGAAGGLALSRTLAALLVNASSTVSNPLSIDLSLDWTVFGFACAAGLLSAVVFGFAPALRAAHIAPADAFKGGNATVPRSVMRMRRALLTGQIAVTVVLITGAVLFGSTLRNLLTLDAGFKSDNVVLGELDLRRTPVPKEARTEFFMRLLERTRPLAQVASAALSNTTPISGSTWQHNVKVETDSGWKDVHIHFNGVTPAFFETFGTRIIAGRGFTERDGRGAPPVALVNSTFARTVFGNANPIGRHLSQADPQPRTVEIVGIVQDAKYRNLRVPVPPTIYEPFTLNAEGPGWASIALRGRGPVGPLLRDMNTILSKEYPTLSFRLTTFRAQIDDSLSRERVFALVCALFGGLALCLAAVGIYGVLSYFVEQRRPEFGIRIALGATPADVRRLVYVQCFSALAVGAVIGCGVALWGAKFTRSMLYGITPAQPSVYLIVVAIVAAVALLAALVPAARASRAMVMNLLRCE